MHRRSTSRSKEQAGRIQTFGFFKRHMGDSLFRSTVCTRGFENRCSGGRGSCRTGGRRTFGSVRDSPSQACYGFESPTDGPSQCNEVLCWKPPATLGTVHGRLIVDSRRFIRHAVRGRDRHTCWVRGSFPALFGIPFDGVTNPVPTDVLLSPSAALCVFASSAFRRTATKRRDRRVRREPQCGRAATQRGASAPG